MTHFDRALTKAFTRRESPAPPAEATATDTTRGWVSRVRVPSGRAAEPGDASAPVVALPETASTAVPPGCAAGNPPEHIAAVADDRIIDLATTASTGQTIFADSPKAWRWPAITTRLLESSAAADLRRLAVFLESLPQERTLQSIAFCGPGRAAGRTSLLLTVARILMEEAELRLLLVDADSDHAGLSVEPVVELSTVEDESPAIAGQSRSPRIVRWTGGSGTTEQYPAETVNGGIPDDWRKDFDLLLIDAGSWKALYASGLPQAGVVDAVVSVRRYDAVDDDEAARRLCGELGMRLLGVVETFVPEKFDKGSQAA